MIVSRPVKSSTNVLAGERREEASSVPDNVGKAADLVIPTRSLVARTRAALAARFVLLAMAASTSDGTTGSPISLSQLVVTVSALSDRSVDRAAQLLGALIGSSTASGPMVAQAERVSARAPRLQHLPRCPMYFVLFIGP